MYVYIYMQTKRVFLFDSFHMKIIAGLKYCWKQTERRDESAVATSQLAALVCHLFFYQSIPNICGTSVELHTLLIPKCDWQLQY